MRDDSMNRERSGDRREGVAPSDTEALVGDTAASEPLTASKRVQPPEAESRAAANSPIRQEAQDEDHASR